MREKSLPFFYCFVVILHHKEGVDLIPANIELSAIEVSLVNAMSRELILKSMVEKLRDFYDFIIIECMPFLGTVSYTHLTLPTTNTV